MKKIITKGKTERFALTAGEFLHLVDMNELTFRKCLRLVPLSYKNITIPKKNGGQRIISVPKDDLKRIQRVILDKIFSKIKLPACAYGFSKGKTIIENANYHAKSESLLNLDIQNFFPSVHFEKVKQIFRDMGFDETISDILCQLTTFEHKLPQGAPTSPFIASFALNNLDYRLLDLARKNYISYSRYFDDLCFSGGKRVAVLEKDISKIISQEGYKVKRKKRQYFTKGETKEVNGISIANGKLFLKNTDVLFLYLNELKDFGLRKLRSDNPGKEYASLVGKVSFLKAIDSRNGELAEEILKSIHW